MDDDLRRIVEACLTEEGIVMDEDSDVLLPNGHWAYVDIAPPRITVYHSLPLAGYSGCFELAHPTCFDDVKALVHRLREVALSVPAPQQRT